MHISRRRSTTARLSDDGRLAQDTLGAQRRTSGGIHASTIARSKAVPVTPSKRGLSPNCYPLPFPFVTPVDCQAAARFGRRLCFPSIRSKPERSAPWLAPPLVRFFDGFPERRRFLLLGAVSFDPAPFAVWWGFMSDPAKLRPTSFSMSRMYF